METEVKPYSKLAGRLYSFVRFTLVARLAGRSLRRLAKGALIPRDDIYLAFGFR